MTPRPHVVVVGGGFGGLQCARALAAAPVDVTLVDERNYHLFTPLLYQVASCLLSPSEIATPLRMVFRGCRNVRYRSGRVVQVDLARHEVRLDDGAVLGYDHVVLAPGSTTNYYGKQSVEEHALGLKDLSEALQLRNHVLECLDRGATTDDPLRRRTLLTFCIVGGGPTGVEYAGALAELARLVLPAEYRELARSDVRIVLLEGSDRVLPMFVPRLSRYALRTLRRLGVEVHLEALVERVEPGRVVLTDGRAFAAETVVWTAGVHAVDLVEHDHRRTAVDDHLRVVGTTNAYVIGDAAAAPGGDGTPLPMLAAVAMQAGRYVAREIVDGPSRSGFRYRDKGTLATIGRSAAVGQLGPLRFTGLVGWLVWLAVHFYYLIGFENRLRVLARWSWYYARLERPVRIIVRAHEGVVPARTDEAERQ